MVSRASSPERASGYKLRGHKVERLFAREIGVEEEYKNNRQAKKDVVDQLGDAHSVKAGNIHWQMFLYGRERFINDDGFRALNGVGNLLVHCLDVFPATLAEYRANKKEFREKLKVPIADLKDRFQRKALLRAFLNKSLFNSGEVDYLSFLHDGKFHVFKSQDVISVLGSNLEVDVNSTGQKVVMKYLGTNLAELEVRNDSSTYKNMLFNIKKKQIVALLFDKFPIHEDSEFSKNVFVYGTAIKTFSTRDKTSKQADVTDLNEALTKLD
jgi:hypothetical protein